jgi:2-keto-4-pentenoate hydratase/2-oxohepta-3-ene-1,7-dioic acid hydratase in catechol pathway
MRLCTFVLAGEGRDRQRAGIVQDSKVYELKSRRTIRTILDEGGETSTLEASGNGYEIERVAIGAPVRPGKIVAAIVNTRAMLGGSDIGLDRPRLDMKAPSTVIGPEEKILVPSTGIRPEVELAAVVGRRISKATVDVAAQSFLGYTILNDVTAPRDSRDDAYEAYRRDRNTGEIRKTSLRGPLFRSKNHDTFCPMGPWIATPDEERDWSDLRMSTKFEGAMVQDGSTSEYLFSPETIASYVSGFLTLEPGDVVSCGSVGWTPSALGSLDPTEYILPSREGLLELEIEGIGKLRNPVVSEGQGGTLP